MKRALAAAGLIVVASGLTGCVAASRYSELEAQRDVLQSEQEKLTQDIARLQEDLGQLRTEAEALAAKRDSIRMAADSLENERDALKKAQAETVNHYDALVSQLSQEVKQGHLQVRRYKNMLTVDVADQIFFASGSADIKESGQAILKKVGKALAPYPDKIIRVVGHTDNVPLTKARQKLFPTNWELSVARATHVVRFLQDQCKIDPERLVAAGRGPYQEVASNSTPEGRQKNRRIEIMLLDKNLAEGVTAVSKDR